MTIAIQPTIFIPHGAGPCFFMDWNPPTAWQRMGDFLKGVAATLPRRPSAIVMVSAHWQEPDFSVTSGAKPGMIFDYYGFPPHTYELSYPAPGSPDLAARARALLATAGIDSDAPAVSSTDTYSVRASTFTGVSSPWILSQAIA